MKRCTRWKPMHALVVLFVSTVPAEAVLLQQRPVKLGPLVDLVMLGRNGVAESVPVATRSTSLDSLGRVVRTGTVVVNGSGAFVSQFSIGDDVIVRSGDPVPEIPPRLFFGAQSVDPTEEGYWWVAGSEIVPEPASPYPFIVGFQLIYSNAELVGFTGMKLRPSGASGHLMLLGANRGEAANAHCMIQRADWWDSSTGIGNSGAVKFRTDAAGKALPPEIVLERNAQLPGGGGTLLAVWNVAISSDERVAASISSTTGSGGWVDGAFVLKHADPGPNPGETISDVWDISVNRYGSWAAQCDLNTGAHVVYREGAVVMHGDTDFLPRRVTHLSRVHITDRGDVFYEYWLDDYTYHIGCNGAPLISSDVDTIGGSPIVAVHGPAHPNPMINCTASFLSLDVYKLHPNGGYQNFSAAYALELSDPVCGGAVSAQGIEPEFGVYRSDVAASDQTSVFSRHLPPSTPALVLAGRTTAFLPGAGGADGALCIGSPVRSRPRTASADGTLEFFVDAALNEVGSALPAAGDFWAFQLWYRDFDPITGAPTSRFTEAVSITFR